MVNRVRGKTLIDNVDTHKVNSASLKKARQLISEHQNDYLKAKTNHCPVQLDKRTYDLLKQIKNRYGVYYYDAVKESLLLMSAVLKK